MRPWLRSATTALRSASSASPRRRRNAALSPSVRRHSGIFARLFGQPFQALRVGEADALHQLRVDDRGVVDLGEALHRGLAGVQQRLALLAQVGAVVLQARAP